MKLIKTDERKWNALTYTIVHKANDRIYKYSYMFWREEFRNYRSVIAYQLRRMRHDLRTAAMKDEQQ